MKQLSKQTIKKDILVEELVENYPFSVRFLMEKGIRCIMCGEPIWGTLEDAAIEKGYTDEGINKVVVELNMLASEFREN
jgi:hypothetical protein